MGRKKARAESRGSGDSTDASGLLRKDFRRRGGTHCKDPKQTEWLRQTRVGTTITCGRRSTVRAEDPEKSFRQVYELAGALHRSGFCATHFAEGRGGTPFWLEPGLTGTADPGAKRRPFMGLGGMAYPPGVICWSGGEDAEKQAFDDPASNRKTAEKKEVALLHKPWLRRHYQGRLPARGVVPL